MRTDLALDALEMGLWSRQHAGQPVDGLIHHSDRGVQYVAIRYTQRLADGRRRSLGRLPRRLLRQRPRRGLQLTVQADLVRNKGPWKNIAHLEIAVAECIDWFNHRRLHDEIGLIPPAEYEDTHYRHNPAPTPVGASVQSLH